MELALSRGAMFYHGLEKISWRELRVALESPRTSVALESDPLNTILAVHKNNKKILNLLREFHAAECSDPRDKLFAIYGLATDLDFNNELPDTIADSDDVTLYFNPRTINVSEEERSFDGKEPLIHALVDYNDTTENCFTRFTISCLKIGLLPEILEHVKSFGSLHDRGQHITFMGSRLVTVKTTARHLKERATDLSILQCSDFNLAAPATDSSDLNHPSPPTNLESLLQIWEVVHVQPSSEDLRNIGFGWLSIESSKRDSKLTDNWLRLMPGLIKEAINNLEGLEKRRSSLEEDSLDGGSHQEGNSFCFRYWEDVAKDRTLSVMSMVRKMELQAHPRGACASFRNAARAMFCICRLVELL
ncbi:uncharacterized protein BDZ99DRAFT_100345 [Mytilinidion resinicola]|uniref:Uncharacterized protein n=1 Tax=Mytilinidion resinicola TaxID=574789 RepID=A0A6A6YAT5_9PEZI|nr:uncharacterized protein BDZ99DRAFT_100345 [Mytilinidion resinicola]KAF2805931.1 hypothetical protein BDZ99DRAFT_100345 [Mytilinidion resinicola]